MYSKVVCEYGSIFAFQEYEEFRTRGPTWKSSRRISWLTPGRSVPLTAKSNWCAIKDLAWHRSSWRHSSELSWKKIPRLTLSQKPRRCWTGRKWLSLPIAAKTAFSRTVLSSGNTSSSRWTCTRCSAKRAIITEEVSSKDVFICNCSWDHGMFFLMLQLLTTNTPECMHLFFRRQLRVGWSSSASVSGWNCRRRPSCNPLCQAHLQGHHPLPQIEWRRPVWRQILDQPGKCFCSNSWKFGCLPWK